MTGSCGPRRHAVLLAWDPQRRLLALVCRGCGLVVVAAHESASALMCRLMREINAGGQQ